MEKLVKSKSKLDRELDGGREPLTRCGSQKVGVIVWLVWLALLASILLPILASPHRGDDQGVPVAWLAEGRRDGENTVQTAIRENTEQLRESGRLLLGHWALPIVEFGTLEFGELSARQYIKALYILLTCVFLVSVAVVVSVLVGTSLQQSSLIMVIVAAIGIQFRQAPTLADPYLAGYGITQVLAVILCFSIVTLVAGKRKRLLKYVVALLAYVSISVLYEGNITFAVLLALVAYWSAQTRSEGLWRATGFLFSAIIMVGLVYLSRSVGANDDYVSGYVPNVEGAEIVRAWTLLNLGNLPLTFVLTHLGNLEGLVAEEIIWASGVLGAVVGLSAYLVFGSGRTDGRANVTNGEGALARPRLSDYQVASCSILLLVLPNLPVSLVGKYQEEVTLGLNHVNVIFGLIGLALLMAVAFRNLRGTLVRRRLLLVGVVVVLGVSAGVTAISNLRIVLLEQPGKVQRDRWEEAIRSGAVLALGRGGTTLVSNRDFGWGPGNLSGVLGDYIYLLSSGEERDIRLIDSIGAECIQTRDLLESREICRKTKTSGVWFLGFRTSLERTTIISVKISGSKVPGGIGRLTEKLVQGRAIAQQIVVAVRGVSKGRRPALTGRRFNGKEFRVSDVSWKIRKLPEDWVLFSSGPIQYKGINAYSLDDPDSPVNFYESGETAPEIIEKFGRMELVRDILPWKW